MADPFPDRPTHDQAVADLKQALIYSRLANRLTQFEQGRAPGFAFNQIGRIYPSPPFPTPPKGPE